MAEAIGALRVEISASTAAFEASMGKASGVLNKWTEGQQRSAMAMNAAHDQALKMNAATEQTTKATGSALGNLAKMTIGLYAVKAAVGFVTDSLKAQGQQEAAINKLNQALANQGIYTEKTSKSLIDYSGALQEVSTFADDVILDGMGMLASFGLNEEQIKKTSKAALDFAAATGKDLTTSMTILGKAALGNTKELTKLGFTFDKNATDAQKLDSAIAQVEQRFGGQALAATQSYEGAMAQLSNQFGEVQESLGKFLGTLSGSDQPFGVATTALKGMASFIGGDLIIAFSEANAQLREFLATVLGAGKFLTPIAEGLAKLGFKSDVLDNLAYGADSMAASIREGADATRQMGDAAATGSGKVKVLTAEEIKAAAAAKAAADAAKRGAEAKAAAVEATKRLTAANKEWNTWLQAELLDIAREEAAVEALGQALLNASMDKTWEAADKAASHYATVVVSATEMAIAEARQEILVNKERAEQHLRVTEQLYAEGKASKEALAAAVAGAHAAKGAWTGATTTVKTFAEQAQRVSDKARDIGDALYNLSGLFTALGVSADSALARVTSGLTDVADGVAQGAQAIAQWQSNPIAAVGSAIGAVLSVAKGLGTMFGAGPSAAEKLAHDLMVLRTEFITTQGGLVVLQEKAAAAGVSLDAMWNARSVAEYEAAVAQVQRAIELTEEATNKTKEAADRWGLTMADLGPKFAGKVLGDQLLSIYEDFRLLTAAGAEAAAVMGDPNDPKSMASAISTLVQQALASGAVLPLAMQPFIQKLAESGKLIDENGEAITDVSGLTFTETLEAGVARLITQIEALVRALSGIPPEVGTMVKVTVQTQHTGGQPPPEAIPDIPEFATGGVGDFGAGSLAMLHGREAIVPLDGGGMVPEVSDAMRSLMGDQKPQVIENHLYLDGQQMRDWIIRQQRVGALTRS